MKNYKLTALYCRFSADDVDKNESNSIQHQKLLLEQFAINNFFTNYKFYVDDGYTGTNFNRPAFTELIENVNDDKIEIIVVKDMSRLGRNYLDVGYYTERLFPEKKVRFIAINDNIDSQNGYDDFIAIRNIINENYARDISKKQRSALAVKGNSGQRLTTRAIYGYKKDDSGQWVIDEYASKVVKKIFDWCLQGYGVGQIASMLKNEKVLIPSLYSKKDKPNDNTNQYNWSTQTISGILSRQEYCGDTVNFKTHKSDFITKKVIKNAKEDFKIFENTHEPIIERTDYFKVQDIRSKKKRISKIDTPCLFADLVYCSDCKKRMHIMRSRNFKEQKPDCFVCSTYRKDQSCQSHYITEKRLIKYVTTDFKRISAFTEKEILDIVKCNITVSKSEYAKKITALKSRYDKIQKVLKKLFEDRVENNISIEIFNILADGYSSEIKQINLELQKSNQIEKSKILQCYQKQFFESLANIKQQKSIELDYGLIHNAIEKIVVYNSEKTEKGKSQKIEIYYNGIGII